MPRVEALVLGPDARLDHPVQQRPDRLERVLEDRREHEVLAPRRVLRVVHRAHVQRADLRPQLAQVLEPLRHRHAQRARRVVDDHRVADLVTDRLGDRAEVRDLVRRRAVDRARVQVHHHAALVHHPPRLGRVLGGRVRDRRALLARRERARHGAGEDDGIVGQREGGRSYRSEPSRAPLAAYIAAVGVGEQVGGVAAVGRERRDAHRGAERHRGPIEGDRLRQRLRDALHRVLHRARAPAEVGQHDDELVAAEPRHQVALAHRAPQPARDLAQRLVTRRVPVRVVDRLEAVEVEHQQPDRPRPRARPRQRGVERPLQRAPVGEPGQRVGVGLVARAPVLLDPRRHVVEGRDRAVELAVVVMQRVRVDLDPQQRPVAPDEAHDRAP